jgi:hypothetical protein
LSYFFAAFSGELFHLYKKACACKELAAQDSANALIEVREKILLTKCVRSARAYSLYLALIALHTPLNVDRLSISPEDHKTIGMGLSEGFLTVEQALAVLRESVQKVPKSESLRAYTSILSTLADILAAPHLERDFAFNRLDLSTAPLRNDPSRADLLLIAARDHMSAGDMSRALQIMRRVCASELSNRAEAESELSAWVANAYGA